MLRLLGCSVGEHFLRTDTDHHVCGSPDFSMTSIFDMTGRDNTHKVITSVAARRNANP